VGEPVLVVPEDDRDGVVGTGMPSRWQNRTSAAYAGVPGVGALKDAV